MVISLVEILQPILFVYFLKKKTDCLYTIYINVKSAGGALNLEALAQRPLETLNNTTK